ncbi:hypothetical protein TUMSATVNIG1_18150 [Vibrio nigripulchritudo]|nr:hypothetical protein VNTUMSATTG_17960 [Vibrio nigripulchritudo]BDU31206.1 hypothetical protein TUMSATVNIG1_18150 [Vibrio nigripulchritudo]BDU37286.1 hypothetical protein TUMSATVNIG2_17550 [Vibrio nigripulchritudo]BDU43006.1 hypothetical protein TUMSATVNIG3_18040 [Vibrio nigripulchritudo]
MSRYGRKTGEATARYITEVQAHYMKPLFFKAEPDQYHARNFIAAKIKRTNQDGIE